MHTPAVAHDMRKALPLTLWVEEHLRRMHLNRWRLVAYLPIGLCIPLWTPLFALAMVTALRDAGALCTDCKSKNRCQKPLLSMCSIFWNKSRNQEEFFLGDRKQV